MTDEPQRLRIGSTVRILQPDDVEGVIGIVLSKEECLDGQRTDRWIIQVISEDILLSLAPEEFEVLD